MFTQFPQFPRLRLFSASSLDTPAAIAPRRRLTLRRIVRGGDPAQPGRLPRYVAGFALGAGLLWAPVLGYLHGAPLRYASSMSLILPGSGASASVNLAEIGQASSYANSAFSSNAVSPTETYKRLIGADRILRAAAQALGLSLTELGSPRVTLVDQTGLIHLQMTGPSPIDAQTRAQAVLSAFFAELDRLRQDELHAREGGGQEAIQDYRASVQATRQAITALQRQTGLLSADQYGAQVAAAESLRTDLDRLRAALENRAGTVRTLSATLGLTPAQAAAALKLFADSEYLAMVRQLSDSAAALASLEARFGPRHPAVTQARAALHTERARAQTRAQALTGLSAPDLARIDRTPDAARADLLSELVRQDTDRAGLLAQTRDMSDRLASATARLDRMAPQAAQLEDMQRDFSVAEAVFASAIARSQSSKSDIFASYPLVQVLENPTLPDRPSSPRRKLVLAAGAGATMLLLIGLVLGWVRGAVLRWLLDPRASA